MERSLPLGSLRRWPLLWTGWSDSIERSSSKLLPVIWCLWCTNRQTNGKRTIPLYRTNCCPIKANVKHFLQLCVQTFQFARKDFSQRDMLTFPSWAVQKGEKMQRTQMPSDSDICGRRKRKSVICVYQGPCLSSGWVWYVFHLRIFYFKSLGVVSDFHFGSMSTFTKFTFFQSYQATCAEGSCNPGN